MAEEEVQSPCISVCTMNDATGLCLGCYRTLEEIEKWWDLDNVQKQELVQKASLREAQLFD
jgi:uncharacterized protein